MKRFIIFMSGILVITSCFPLYAQKIKENDEIFASVGVNVPMYKGVESDMVVGLHYGHYHSNGIGYRVGFNYSPSVADVSNYFGIPLAFTYRMGSRSFSSKVRSATIGAFNSAAGSGDEGLKYGFTAFLMNMFDRIEFSAGLTPGYVSGGSSSPSVSRYGYGLSHWERRWTEKLYGFALSIDAGVNINFRIWRFDLRLMPAFHYNITNNYRYHTEKGDDSVGLLSSKDRPLRWFFTFSGGLAFRF